MVREAAVAQLACAKIGAISVPIFSGFGTAAVIDRLRIAGAKAHIMSNGFHRRGREIAIPADLPPRPRRRRVFDHHDRGPVAGAHAAG